MELIHPTSSCTSPFGPPVDRGKHCDYCLSKTMRPCPLAHPTVTPLSVAPQLAVCESAE